MIISHKYRFIFLKTRKTAGTSVELALAAQCGDEDVVAENRSEDHEEFNDAIGRNFHVPRAQWTARDYLKAALKGKPVYTSHCPARIVRGWVNEDVWSYFKFSIERNPWDRYQSQYYWNTRKGGTYEGMSMSEHFNSVPRYRLSNWDIYAIDGKPVVDSLIRFETLQDDLKAIRERLGLPHPIELPSTKTGFRPKTREPLPEDIADRISEICSREINYLGYSR